MNRHALRRLAAAILFVIGALAVLGIIICTIATAAIADDKRPVYPEKVYRAEWIKRQPCRCVGYWW